MNIIQESPPADILSGCILKYSYKQLSVPAGFVMPAHTDQFLEFYLQGRYTIIDKQNGSEFLSPSSIFIGQQTMPNWDLRLQGNYRMFFIHFTPTGFFRIFNTPMKTLTNQAIDPEGLVGNEVKHLHGQLGNAATFAEMISVVETFLVKKMLSGLPQPDKFDDIIGYINKYKGLVSLQWLVDQSNLSMRQFERRFDQQLGISPKMFIRKTRLNHVLQLRKQEPGLNLTELTYRAGYFDQAHMIKDFKALTGDSPKTFLYKIAQQQ